MAELYSLCLIAGSSEPVGCGYDGWFMVVGAGQVVEGDEAGVAACDSVEDW